jgi:phosphoserine phosphatase RsbU/P
MEVQDATARLLVEHLYAHVPGTLPGLTIGHAYRLAAEDAQVGGDLVDVYYYDNHSTSVSIADISGKGPAAAVHAAMLKYGLRAYVSRGLTAEETMASMNTFYIETCAHEGFESFASIFFAILDQDHEMLLYANAGHEPVFLLRPGEAPETITPTGPLVGVIDGARLYAQKALPIAPGTLLVATTDGITEARHPDGSFFGLNGLEETVVRLRDLEPPAIAKGIVDEAAAFSGGRWRDDVAVIVVRVEAADPVDS